MLDSGGQRVGRKVADNGIAILHRLQEQRGGGIVRGHHRGGGQCSHDRIAREKSAPALWFIEALATRLDSRQTLSAKPLRFGDRTVHGPIEVALIAGVWFIETHRLVRSRDCDVMCPMRRHNAINDLRHMTVVAETSRSILRNV